MHSQSMFPMHTLPGLTMICRVDSGLLPRRRHSSAPLPPLPNHTRNQLCQPVAQSARNYRTHSGHARLNPLTVTTTAPFIPPSFFRALLRPHMPLIHDSLPESRPGFFQDQVLHQGHKSPSRTVSGPWFQQETYHGLLLARMTTRSHGLPQAGATIPYRRWACILPCHTTHDHLAPPFLQPRPSLLRQVRAWFR